MVNQIVAHIMPGFNLAENQAKIRLLNDLNDKNILKLDKTYLKMPLIQSAQEDFYNNAISPYENDIKKATSYGSEEIFFSENCCHAAGTVSFELNGSLMTLIPGYGIQKIQAAELFMLNPEQIKEILDVTVVGIEAVKVAPHLKSFFLKTFSQLVEYLMPPRRPKIITSYGTVENYSFDENLSNRYKNLKKSGFEIFFFTGWDHRDKLDEIKKAEPRSVITENCFLHIPNVKNDGKSWNWDKYNNYPLWDLPKRGKTIWETSLPNKRGIRYKLRKNDEVLSNVIQANKALMEKLPYCLNDKNPPVYRSQSDDAAICYYINIDPDGEIMAKLEKHKKETPRNNLIEIIRKKGLNIINEDELKIQNDTEGHILFILERIMNSYCTMQPYSILISDEKKYVNLILDPEEPSKYLDSKEHMKKIVDTVNTFLGWSSEESNMAPQSDACIDIFILTKEKAFEEAVKILEDKKIFLKNDQFIYLAKGSTSSDSKLVDMLTKRKGWEAYGPPSTDSALVDAGVMPIDSKKLREEGIETDMPNLHDILEYWKRIWAKKFEKNKQAA